MDDATRFHTMGAKRGDPVHWGVVLDDVGSEVLKAVGPSLWLAEGPIVSFYGFPYPTRSVVARLADGGLWVWSPIELSPQVQQAVDALGTVAHLVSPNAIHHLYLQDWQRAYPGACLWGPRSSHDKRPDLRFEPALGDRPPAAWEADIDQVRFSGSRIMDEVVFFHRASSTVIVADLSENFSAAFLQRHWRWWQRPIARLWKIVEGYGYAPLEWRLSFTDRAAARAALERILAWHPRRVIMAHGRWQPEAGEAYLRRAFAWLVPADAS